MSYIAASRMPHARWKSEDEVADPASGAREISQRARKALGSVSATAWTLGALLVGAASAGAAYALRRDAAPRRKPRSRAKTAKQRAATA